MLEKGKIIRTVLCCVVYNSDMHTHEQFLQLNVCLVLGFFLVFLQPRFMFSVRLGILCVLLIAFQCLVLFPQY